MCTKYYFDIVWLVFLVIYCILMFLAARKREKAVELCNENIRKIVKDINSSSDEESIRIKTNYENYDKRDAEINKKYVRPAYVSLALSFLSIILKIIFIA